MPLTARVLDDAEIERRIVALGETFSGTEESFAAFETKFLEAYAVIFDAMSKVATVKESGTSGDADLSMSKWIEPSRVIGVVVNKKSVLKPEIVGAAREALGRMGEKFAVVVDVYPTVAYVFPDGEIAVVGGALAADLRVLGLVVADGAGG